MRESPCAPFWHTLNSRVTKLPKGRILSYNQPLWLINTRRVGIIPQEFTQESVFIPYNWLAKELQQAKWLLPSRNEALKVNLSLIYKGCYIFRAPLNVGGQLFAGD